MQGSPSPLALLMAEGGGIVVLFRSLLNYLLLVFVGSVHTTVTTVSAIMGMYRHAHALCVYIQYIYVYVDF